MGNFRLALAQLDPIVGDLSGNSALIKSAAQTALAASADLLVVPEMMLTGYPIEDLSLRPSFRAAVLVSLNELAAQLAELGAGELVIITGYLDADRNAAAVIHRGKVIAKYFKHHLPNYGVFDEHRYFTAGDQTLTIRVADVDVAIAICEDIWQDDGVISKIKQNNVGLLVVLNGSPYEQSKTDKRLQLVKTRAAEISAAVGYVNMVGGQDELVFDGASFVVSAAGELLARANLFTPELLITDLELPTATAIETLEISTTPSSHASAASIADPLEPLAELWQALVVGLRSYVDKNKFKSVIFGLSGGIDSAVVAALAVDALGANRVNAVAMPSKYSSSHSIADAQDLAARTAIGFRVEEIQPIVDSYLNQLGFTALAEENLQARVRGVILMGISNQEGHLVLATGNKSELAVGYSTIYGDAVGGFAPIKDVSKTLVWQLANWRNAQAIKLAQTPPIPPNSITKEPSAELRPDQKDSDSLPDYLMLDQILAAYVENDQTALDAFDPKLVSRILKMVDAAEYKRRQYPPGTKVSSRAFGRDRRLPITNHWNQQ
ncbi:MAG: NAD+ synthase [Actinomycetota bacterium]|nr:NAD+ synthase [Actinomycetota bacterium]